MEILYSDNRAVVCVKPVGVLSTDEEGGLPSLLREQFQEPQGCFRTVHRLDRTVGGLIVLARSRKAASLLSGQVREGKLGKEYLAVLHGRPEEKCGTLTDLLARDKATHTTFVTDTPGKDVRPAVLDYAVLDEREGLSLVRIRLHTGRTHQIRAQFSSRGMPLFGDRRYGAPEREGTPALWSFRLSFTHPQSGEPLCFVSLPPEKGVWTRFPRSVYPDD